MATSSGSKTTSAGKAGSKVAQPQQLGVKHILVGLTIAGLVAYEAWGVSRNFESTRADVATLLGSLVTMWRGSAQEVAAMPRGTPDLPRDRCAFSAFTAAIFVFNWSVRLLFLEPFARVAVGLRGPQAVKFAQSGLEGMLYGGFAILGLLVVPSQDFVWPSAKWWAGYVEGEHKILRADLRCYYILYVARYAQGLVSVMLEFRRKDFLEMVVHHLVTVVLIYLSYVFGWTRVGVVIMVLLDPADVPLHLAKLCKYTAEASGRHLWQFLADRLFEVFGVTFFITRIVLYAYVCWSAHVEASRYWPKGAPEWACVALLETLLVLQIYWFSLIVKVAIRLMAGTSVEDIRSDDEDEEPQGEEKKGK